SWRFSSLPYSTRRLDGVRASGAWLALESSLPPSPFLSRSSIGRRHRSNSPTHEQTHSSRIPRMRPQKVTGALMAAAKVRSGIRSLFALNAATGEKLWMYDPQVPASWVPYTAACRGVAFYSNPSAAAGQACAERIIEGTLDMRLIAVDAKSGQPCQDFGKNGAADLKVGLAQKDSDAGAVTPVIPGTAAITSAPVIVQGVVVSGHQV